MTRPTLPPQAYTREILTSAFNWLQTQSDSVRKLAQTPDSLVGLYLRSQRFGQSSLDSDAPVSAQNFLSDLKNLAEGLKEFEGPKDQAPMKSFKPRHPAPSAQMQSLPVSPQNSISGYKTAEAPAAEFQARLGVHSQASVAEQAPREPMVAVNPRPSVQQSATTAPPRSDVHFSGLSGLNEKSLRMIHEVKAALNLSADAEVLNLMISLAYKNLKDLIA
jgi:hypothetical protein